MDGLRGMWETKKSVSLLLSAQGEAWGGRSCATLLPESVPGKADGLMLSP